MFLFAAGAVYLDSPVSSDSAVSLGGSSRLAGKGLRVRAAWYCVAAAISLPISLPVLPAAALAKVPVQTINYDLGEEIGWQSEVGLVARVYDSLPASRRSVATVIAGNYGEAGAFERYGPARGLPRAYSGDNNFWLWGPPPSGDTVAVVVGVPPSLLHRYFAHVREVAVFRNGLGVSDDEEGTPIYVATGLRAPWTRAWPAFRVYA